MSNGAWITSATLTRAASGCAGFRRKLTPCALIADGTCKVEPGAAETPRLTLTLELPDFLRFVAGQLDGMQAFMSGKLKLGGDIMLAQTMQTWFAV